MFRPMDHHFDSQGTHPFGARFGSSVVLSLVRVGLIAGILGALLVGWVGSSVRTTVDFHGLILLSGVAGLAYGFRPLPGRSFTLRGLVLPLVVLAFLFALPRVREVLADADGGFVQFLLGMTVLVLAGLSFVPIGRLVGSALLAHRSASWAAGVLLAAATIGAAGVSALAVIGLPPAAGLALFAAVAIGFVGSGDRSKFVDAGALTCCLVMANMA